jgi:hypothetical protein
LSGLGLLWTRLLVRPLLLLRRALVGAALAAGPSIALRLPAVAPVGPALAAWLLLPPLIAAVLVPGTIATMIAPALAAALAVLRPALALRLLAARIACRPHRGVVRRWHSAFRFAGLEPAQDAAQKSRPGGRGGRRGGGATRARWGRQPGRR